MKRLNLFLIMGIFVLLLAIPATSAINVKVEKISENEVLVDGLDKPAVFDLKITNLNGEDNFQFYNLLGFNMFPKGSVHFNPGETKNIELKISPLGSLPNQGIYSFDYYIKSQDGSEVKERLSFRIIQLEEAFEIGSVNVDPESKSMDIYIENKVNFDFGSIHGKFSSPFFVFEEDFSLGPYEQKKFNIELNKEDFKKLMAGFYTLTAKLDVQDKKADVEGVIKFEEKDILTTSKKDYGFLINTQIVEKKNEGNTMTETETVLKKNIISRLFTSFSPEPDIVDRQGLSVYYSWAEELAPGESLVITARTNWLFPLIVIFFVIAIVLLAKQYSKTHLVLRKKVSFVKAKGADFGLKVSVFVQAKKYIERVHITDRLPPLVKVYEKFGVEKPDKVSEKDRKIEWNFEKLEAGETRVLSYIIYSKVGVMGRFALPRTNAVYEHEGEIHESNSNQAFFVAEQRNKDEE